MGKRYYCDYCDKSFADNACNRRNHLKGVIHQQNKKAHYDKFRDQEVILAEEKAKRPCKHFFNSGSCSFLDNCRYSHLTDEDKEELEQQIKKQKESDAAKKKKVSAEMPTLDDWLKKSEKLKTGKVKEKLRKNLDSGVELAVYTTAPCLQGVTNIPPSLLPPPPDVYKTLKLEEWG